MVNKTGRCDGTCDDCECPPAKDIPPAMAEQFRRAVAGPQPAMRDDDLWHIAGVITSLNGGNLFNVSQRECVTAIRAAFMDPDAGRAFIAAQTAPAVPEGQEPLAWESTTPVYTRYITEARYQKLMPEFQKWYRPICPTCAKVEPVIDAAFAQYEQDLKDRKHGGVAMDQAWHMIREVWEGRKV